MTAVNSVASCLDVGSLAAWGRTCSAQAGWSQRDAGELCKKRCRCRFNYYLRFRGVKCFGFIQFCLPFKKLLGVVPRSGILVFNRLFSPLIRPLSSHSRKTFGRHIFLKLALPDPGTWPGRVSSGLSIRKLWRLCIRDAWILVRIKTLIVEFLKGHCGCLKVYL